MLAVAAAVYFSHSSAFTTFLISSANSSDAFKFISQNTHINQKLVDVSRLTESSDSIIPKVLAFASAADMSEESSESSLSSSITTTADNSTIVKPNYTVATAMEGNLAIYKVAAGDNPAIIASRYGIGIPALLRANNMNDGSTIKPGQELKVPLCNGVLYDFKDTDTLDSMMSKFKLSEEDIDELLNCNDVENFEDLNSLAVVVVPQDDLTMPTAPKPTLVRSTRTNTSGRIALGKASPTSAITAGSGQFSWPMPGYFTITQNYSWRHNGIDVSCNKKTPAITAADGGFVEIAGWEAGGWGNTVVINHGNGIKSRYAHMSAIGVSAGDTVTKGQGLGNCGNTGRSTGPHLHFTVYNNGKSVSPWNFLNN